MAEVQVNYEKETISAADGPSPVQQVSATSQLENDAGFLLGSSIAGSGTVSVRTSGLQVIVSAADRTPTFKMTSYSGISVAGVVSANHDFKTKGLEGGGFVSVSDQGTTVRISAAARLNQLGDVDLTGASNGDVLALQSGVWVARPNTLTGLSGSVSVAKGGTGRSSVSAGALLVGNADNPLAALPVGTQGQFLRVSSNAPAWGDAALADLEHLTERRNGPPP